jgi:hypothetical protein
LNVLTSSNKPLTKVKKDCVGQQAVVSNEEREEESAGSHILGHARSMLSRDLTKLKPDAKGMTANRIYSVYSVRFLRI